MSVEVIVRGDLMRRLVANFDRVESERYHLVDATPGRPGLFQPPGYEWPGDFEGRTLLAWILLERATGRQATFLGTALWRLGDVVAGQGYFGSPSDPDLIDEQQLAGHGWVLRALSEHAVASGNDQAMAWLARMTDVLALPTRGRHATYPIDPNGRHHHLGGVIGEPAETVDGWRVSSDVGCDFIFLDGLAQAATLLGRPEVDKLVDEIVDRFLQVDLEAINAHAHATLTGVRALLRWYRHTGRPELLAAASDRYRRYTTAAMSENFANWNWFGRPTHTEPCAIVDSFLVAVELWRLTGDPDRLAEAHEIYYNALGHAQRVHGGFGCDSVLGADETDPDVLRPVLDEAWWCCTMRGAEGLATAASLAAVERDDELTFPMFFSAEITHHGVHSWRAESDYPWEGVFRLEYDGGPGGPVRLAFYAGPWARRPSLRVRGVEVTGEAGADGFVRVAVDIRQGDVIEFAFAMSPKWTPCRRLDRAVVRRGPLLFGADGSNLELTAGSELRWVAERRHVQDLRTGASLRPLGDAAVDSAGRQVCFVSTSPGRR